MVHILRKPFNLLYNSAERLVSNREGRFMGVVLALYALSLAGLLIALRRKLIEEHEAITATVVSSVVAFSMLQVAFVAKAKSLERMFHLKSVLFSLFEEIDPRDRCVGTYIGLGEQTAKIMQESRTDKTNGSGRALMAFSQIAIDRCQVELADILHNRHLERTGVAAYDLTQRCYEFATQRVLAVALGSSQGIRFWSNYTGSGNDFYKCNKKALDAGVAIDRYFFFSALDIAALDANARYRSEVLGALAVYIENLPRSDMYLACRVERWEESFTWERYSSANTRFTDFYKGSFPDVSLFDETIASLWKGSSDRSVNMVRITCENDLVRSVKHLFRSVLVERQRHSIVTKRGPAQDPADLLDAFLTKARTLEWRADSSAT